MCYLQQLVRISKSEVISLEKAIEALKTNKCFQHEIDDARYKEFYWKEVAKCPCPHPSITEWVEPDGCKVKAIACGLCSTCKTLEIESEDNMGYFTQYKLDVQGLVVDIEPGIEEEVIKKAREMCPMLEYAVDETGDTLDSTKWYDHKEDMLIISKAFQNIIFTLKGEGEEARDVWEKHFCNGVVQDCRASVIIPPLDTEMFTHIEVDA